MKHILFLFLDGVGLAPSQPENPFSVRDGDSFSRLAGDQRWVQPFGDVQNEKHLVRSIDATLGVDGLPQSGTGQATLFTGINCAQMVGRHFGPYPHSKTFPAIDQNNLFAQISQRANRPSSAGAFANAFPPQYFEQERKRSTVTTRCCEASDIPIRGIEELRNDRALSADLTGRAWRQILDLDIPERTPAESGSILASIARSYSVTLFEYFLTDKLGHGRIDIPPSELLGELDAFLGALVKDLNLEHETLLITSDHGNMEDLSHDQHTRNPVPMIVYGWAAPFFETVESLTEVTPALLRALAGARPR